MNWNKTLQPNKACIYEFDLLLHWVNKTGVFLRMLIQSTVILLAKCNALFLKGKRIKGGKKALKIKISSTVDHIHCIQIWFSLFHKEIWNASKISFSHLCNVDISATMTKADKSANLKQILTVSVSEVWTVKSKDSDYLYKLRLWGQVFKTQEPREMDVSSVICSGSDGKEHLFQPSMRQQETSKHTHPNDKAMAAVERKKTWNNQRDK